MKTSIWGAPKFMVKMLPVSKLDTDFSYDQSKILIYQIKDSRGNLVAIIRDNNLLKKVFFKRFSYIKPRRTEDNVLLLFDLVQFLKSIQNNWITEKKQQAN